MARNLPQVIQDTLGNITFQLVQATARAETAEAQLAEMKAELDKLKVKPQTEQEREGG